MLPVERYLAELRTIRSSGQAVKETSYYPALASLLNEIGQSLSPKVRCILTLKNRGAGQPDGGLFTPDQFQRTSADEPRPGQIPSRGVIEVKSAKDDAWLTADGEQVTRYWGKYQQVLVTNYRDFVMVGKGPDGSMAKLESFRLADSEKAFWTATAHPKTCAQNHGQRLIDYLKRVMLHAVQLRDPADVAWFLASYAREAKARIASSDLPELATIRKALEEALGLRFESARGDHFFRSTLIQTLFYGIFSAWVLWSRQLPPGTNGAKFDWRMSAQYLKVPILRKLFHEVADPGPLEALGLTEVLNWAGLSLNRVARAQFFTIFSEGHAVQYFYEPFLEAFDPELRKELGVWYTPTEVVQYMVARVDTVLREDLGIPDGLADRRVYVLDPCCGTGAYLVEVLKRIASTLQQKGDDALIGQDIKQAAMERVFGFEILPAPFVVAHLQLGLLLQTLGGPLSDKKKERAGIYLTNALTGWDPPESPKTHLLFPELEEERDKAEKVKQDTPILVILGNPPYNSFAGVAVDEERDLSDAYRTTTLAPAPEGQGLNDLYVRFFRMAERRIVERTGSGVVCYISNYSWMDGRSFPGMREHFSSVFDRIWVDCLNGDKYKTGKVTPDGRPDPSIFSTEQNREGIQVGTAIVCLVRRPQHQGPAKVEFRHFWGTSKRTDLLKSLKSPTSPSYHSLDPVPEMGFPFVPLAAQSAYLMWPILTDLFPTSFPGVKTSRDDVVINIDKKALEDRMKQYFDPDLSDEEIRRLIPGAMESSARFDAKAVRKALVKRGFIPDQIVRYAYRPFDLRWIYWEPETKLLDEKRADYRHHVRPGNQWFSAGQRNRKEGFYQPQLTPHLADHHIVESNVGMFPLYLYPDPKDSPLLQDCNALQTPSVNLSDDALLYLGKLSLEPEDLFYYTIALLHSPAYRSENAGALRQNWPRIPLPRAASLLQSGADLGKQLATFLDPEQPAKGVTSGQLRPEMKVIGSITRKSDGNLRPDVGELEVHANWGFAGKGGITMPGKGIVTKRNYTSEEISAFKDGTETLGLSRAQVMKLLGPDTVDVYLNQHAYWRNIPARAWQYTIGGYPVIKKWLSYREKELLGRSLTKEEVREVTNMARRISAILLLEPALDTLYKGVLAASHKWTTSTPGKTSLFD